MRPIERIEKLVLHVGVASPKPPGVLLVVPQWGIQVERIVISSECLESWQVDSLAVAGKPEFDGVWPVPALAFSAGSLGRTAFQVKAGEPVEIRLTWLGPPPRFSVYRRFWAWVSRKQLPRGEASVSLFGRPSEK